VKFSHFLQRNFADRFSTHGVHLETHEHQLPINIFTNNIISAHLCT